MHDAVIEGHIPRNPLDGCKIKRPKPNPIIYLTFDEVMKIYSYTYANETYRKCADVFVFQCFTGLSHADTLSFNQSHLQTLQSGKTFIVKEREKSGQLQRIPLLPLPEAILKQYDYKLPVYVNQVANRLLKEIALTVGITKTITCHVARKTAACFFYNKLSPRATAAILGHATTQMTETHYAKVMPEQLEEDVKVLFEL